jgi:threonine aldolase
VPVNRADRWYATARACDRILSGIRPMSMRERLAALDAFNEGELDARPDAYGDGPVTALEERVAELLGKPAAVFFPTGTMAQQVALRIWAEASGNPTVALHPQAHPEVHERDALSTLTGLRTVWPTRDPRPPTAEEVSTLDEPFGTLLLELPLREPGYLLPTWDELVAVSSAARSRSAHVHFDGARIWETMSFFGQPVEAIAALADSVYVSFYKTLGGISGAALAGPVDFVATARAWRHRYGGNVFQQWPSALAALRGLSVELPRLPSYVEHARRVASALASLPGARIHPLPPHTHQFQLLLPHPAEALNEAVFALAEEEKVFFAGVFRDVQPTGYALTEVTVAAPGLEFTPDDVVALGTAVLARLPDLGR